MDACTLIDELDEIVYVSDRDTYELLFVNKIGQKLLGTSDYQGKKCYALIQGLTSPCPFCTNDLLREDEMYVWEHDNKLLNRHFLVKDKLINWHGRKCRLEIAVDVTDKENVSRAIEKKLKIAQLLVECIRRLLEEGDLDTAINRVLESVGQFYQASRAYIFEYSDQTGIAKNTYEWCADGVSPQINNLQMLTKEDISGWLYLFAHEDMVVIEDLEALKETRRREYDILHVQGIHSLVAVPLKIKHKIVGFIGVDNPKSVKNGNTLLESLSYFVITEMKNRQMRERFRHMSYHDSLTGLYNRTKFNEHTDELRREENSSIGIVFADINGLKKINDSFGHERGDSLIVHVAKTLVSIFPSEYVYRLGGDEFVVLYEHVDEATFADRVEKAKDAFSQQKEKLVSLGYAYAKERADIRKLTNIADEMMYLEKQNYYEQQLTIHDAYSDQTDVRSSYRAMAYMKGLDDIHLEKSEGRRRVYQYNAIINQTFDAIYEISLERNWIKSRYMGEERIQDFPSGLTLEESVDYVANRLIHPDDRAPFLQLVNIANLKRRFAQNRRPMELECRFLDIFGEYRWAQCTFVFIQYPQELDNGENTLLVLLEYIDDRMNARLKEINVERKHYLALRQLCNYICDIDVKSGAFTMSINGNEMSTYFPDTQDYETAHGWMTEHLVHPQDRVMYQQSFTLSTMMKRFADGVRQISMDYRMVTDTGQTNWMRNIAVYLEGERTGQDAILIIVKLVNEEKETDKLRVNNMLLQQEVAHQKEMNFHDTRYRIIVEQTGAEVFEWNRNADLFQVKGNQERGGSFYVSPQLMALFGYIGKDGQELAQYLLEQQMVHPDDVEKYRNFFFPSDKRLYRELLCRVRPMGQDDYVWYKATITILLDGNGQKERIIGTVVDVDQETRAKLALQERAETDSLTGILNGESFYIKADEIKYAHPDRQFAVIVMDIDKFKIVNDLYGMSGGNRVLVEVAQILQDMIGEKDICARRYADVFLIFTQCDQEKQIKHLVKAIERKISKLNLDVVIMPYFGVCWVNDPMISAEEYCELASFAHKSIKERARVNWGFYDDRVKKDMIKEKQMEGEMSLALEAGEFHAFLQPKMDFCTGQLVGAEALVRWIHPRWGMIPPAKFIPLFEHNGFILKLDEEIWRQTCGILRRWMDEGKKPVPISVNVSRMHLLSTKLLPTLIALTEEWKVPRELLILELTESLFVDNISYYEKTLNELRQAGFLLAMDDFGSGYSSLNMLKDIPIDILKIDCGFLSETVASDRGKTIIQHIIAMVKDLDICIIAEGVETKEQAQFLLEAGCPIGQGYYYAKPIPVEEFEAFWADASQPLR